MNDIIKRFLWASDKFMPEMHLRDLVVGTYSVCGPFTKHKQRIQRLMETGDTNFVYKNDLDKVCFQYDMAYNKYKDLQRRTRSDRVLKDKDFKIASDLKRKGYERELISMVYKFFDKKSKGAGILNQQLANELHKPIIRKF